MTLEKLTLKNIPKYGNLDLLIDEETGENLQLIHQVLIQMFIIKLLIMK